MNPLVFVLLGVVINQIESRVLPTEQNGRFDAEEKCIKELGLDRYELMRVAEYPSNYNEDDANFFVCVWERRGVMDKDGTISENGLKNFFKDINPEGDNFYHEFTDKVTEMCVDSQLPTVGETAIMLKNCLILSRELLSSQLHELGNNNNGASFHPDTEQVENFL